MDCDKAVTRKHRHQASGMVQEVFLVFTEATYGVLLKEVRLEDGKLHVYEENYTSKKIRFSFQDHLVKCERQKQAVLTFNECTAALGFMCELMQVTFKDTSKGFRFRRRGLTLLW